MLAGIGFLGVGGNDDPAAEDTLRILVENALVEFTAGPVRYPVVDLGVVVDEYPEGLAVAGGQALNSGTINAAGDHRIALAMAAVGLTAHGLVTIGNAEAMAVSYPDFATVLESVAQR